MTLKKVECLIMDWAGTAVDFGCFAPVSAIVKAFEENGIHVSEYEVRKPMGKAKIAHIGAMLQMESICRQFRRVNQRDWTSEDVITINKSFEHNLFLTLHDYAKPITGVIETVNTLRKQGIKIGSTTGYTRAMMDIVQPEAEKQGYQVDSCVTPDLLPAGRPAPFMIFQNMINLDVRSLDSVVKVGDTIEDIREGLSAHVHVVGIITGSSELGLSEDDINRMSRKQLHEKIENVRNRMTEAGANYVIDTISELPDIIQQINTKQQS
jgi:phosphonoacetaldehyde hydrolase